MTGLTQEWMASLTIYLSSSCTIMCTFYNYVARKDWEYKPNIVFCIFNSLRVLFQEWINNNSQKSISMTSYKYYKNELLTHYTISMYIKYLCLTIYKNTYLVYSALKLLKSDQKLLKVRFSFFMYMKLLRWKTFAKFWN